MAHLTRRSLLAGLTATAATPLRAQAAWPERPITLVHGLAPGGPSDIIARIVAESLSRRLGQQVVVDARPGAGGRVAAAQIAKVAARWLHADGHPVGPCGGGGALQGAELPHHRRFHDDQHAHRVSVRRGDQCGRSHPHASRELIDAARTRGTPLLFGSAGNGSLQHLAGELLAKSVECQIPARALSRSAPQAITDLLAQRIDFIVDSPTAELEFIRAGKVRALAVTGATRLLQPAGRFATTAEVACPISPSPWQGLLGARRPAAAIVARLNAEVARSAGRAVTGSSAYKRTATCRAPRRPRRSRRASPRTSTSGPRW